jgi:predicted Zn-dependent protease
VCVEDYSGRVPEIRLAVAPVGRLDTSELEAAVAHVAKVLHHAVEVREPANLSRAHEDAARGQFRAGPMLAELRAAAPRLRTVKTIGTAPPGAAPGVADTFVLVTDVDLFTPATAGVLDEIDRAHRAALVSVRRLREVFYRRKADPGKQRSRLVKAILRAVGKARGLPDCNDPSCALSPTGALADLDRKAERYCSPCWKRLSEGVSRL